jgi:hypothetical protein
MRCQCCNANLSDYESVLKHPDTLEYLDTCKRCLRDIPVVPMEPNSYVDDTSYEDDDYEDLHQYINEDNDNDF